MEDRQPQKIKTTSKMKMKCQTFFDSHNKKKLQGGRNRIVLTFDYFHCCLRALVRTSSV